MPEITSCPSCQRKLQVPEALLGQNVQCPTCGNTFVANVNSAASARSSPPPLPEEKTFDEPWREPPQRRPARGRLSDDYDEEDEYEERRYRRRDLAPHRGGAVLAIGIISLVSYLVCAPIGLIMGIIAWVMGQQDLAEIRAGRMDPEGEGQTNAGRICGMIATIIGGLVVAAVCLIFVISAAAPRGFR